MSINAYNSKAQVLADFIDKYRNLPKQGSAEWIKGREASFGGSELAALIGKNKNKTCRKLLEEKVSPVKFEGNSFTLWGQLFEPVHRAILEQLFNADIHETGSIPWVKEGFKYSPDGIGVVKRDTLLRVLKEGGITHLIAGKIVKSIEEDAPEFMEFINGLGDDMLILFEQKAPANRIPTYSIPEYYVPQILSGLNVIDISDFGFYTEACFKRCSLADLHLHSNAYNECFGFSKHTYLTLPKYTGVVILSTKNNKLAHDIKLSYFRNGYTSDMYIDYGDASKETFFNILQQWKDTGDINLHYSYGDGEAFYETFESITETIIGVIPWKLFDMQNHIVYKKDSYLESYHPAIMVGIDTIKRCKECKFYDDIKKIIDEGVINISNCLPK